MLASALRTTVGQTRHSFLLPDLVVMVLASKDIWGTLHVWAHCFALRSLAYHSKTARAACPSIWTVLSYFDLFCCLHWYDLAGQETFRKPATACHRYALDSVVRVG